MTGTEPVGHLDPRLEEALSASARDRLLALAAEVTAEPTRVRVRHPAAARLVGRGPLDTTDPAGLRGPTVDDAVRTTLLVALARALRERPATLLDEVGDLYRYGDSDEKRAVLRSLPLLDVGDAALPLVSDALRTNDVRLVAAALGEYGGRHLPDDAWRQGVLKCLFVEVPLAAVARLGERADGELARMVAAYCHERVAAGRTVPADVWRVLDRHPDALEETPLRAELDSPFPDRRAAARDFLDSQPPRGSISDDGRTRYSKEA